MSDREATAIITPKLGYLIWDDLRFPATGINPPGASSDPALDATDGCWNFSKSATNVLAGVAQLPHSWLAGSMIYPHIHWCPISTGGGNVLWRFSYSIAAINGTFGTDTDVDKLAAAGTTANKHLITSFGGISMSSISSVSAIIKWKISRIGGDGTDTLDEVAKLLEFDIHFQSDSLGSGNEFLK